MVRIRLLPAKSPLRTRFWCKPRDRDSYYPKRRALGSRAVNARFRSLCFVALFYQVVDCHLLGCVSSVDLPWRCGGHSHSPRPSGQVACYRVDRRSNLGLILTRDNRCATLVPLTALAWSAIAPC